MKQMLISGTRQWNPGDEFIMFGVQALLEDYFVGEDINWVLYDRNPDISPHRPDMLSNSWSKRYNINMFDYVVIGGSPEWSGRRLNDLYQQAYEGGKKVLIFGVGTRGFLDDTQKHLFEKSEFISTRDTDAKWDITTRLNKKTVHLFPCPALFATKDEKRVKELGKIGLVIQANNVRYQSADNLEEMTNLYNKLSKDYDVEVVCHYIDEYNSAFNITDKVAYAYDAKSYEDIYKKYDFVISTRIHGAVLANSLGIPSILFNKDSHRCNIMSKQFPYIKSMNFDQIVEYMNTEIDVMKLSAKILAFKRETRKEYLKAMVTIGRWELGGENNAAS